MRDQISSKRTLKDIIKVTISNVVKLLSGVLVAFLLPKVIGVTDYGYYKTFTLYATYVGLFHLGFADGIYLKYGDKDYEDLERSKFRLYSSFLFLLELLFSVVLGVVFFFSLQGELRFIFLCLIAHMFSTNVINYYQIISQITKRFNELSIRNIIQSILTALAVFALWLVYKFNNGELLSYRIYTLIFVSIFILLAIWYVITYRDLTFGKGESFKGNWKHLFSFFLIGFPLLIANLCSVLILAIDRQFVSILFDTDTYAVYAFAYNMLALITTALSAISTVIYPTLKRTNKETLKSNYSLLIEIILIFVFACLLVYFPLMKFIPWFLPKYTDSLPIFRVILPGLAVSSAITIVMHNYYKTEGKELMFFIKSLIILALSAGANVLAYILFKTTIAISVASIIVMVLWYFLIEEYFIRSYKVKWIKNCLYMFLMAGGFYAVTIWNNWWATLLIYFAYFVALTLFFFWKDINNIGKKFFKKKNEEEQTVQNEETEINQVGEQVC